MTTSHGQAKPITSQAGTQDSKVERTVVCCMELFCESVRKKAEPSNQIESVPDATTSTLQQKTGEPTFVALRPSECKEFSLEGLNTYFVMTTCKIRGTVRKECRTPRLDSTSCSHRHTDHSESNLHTKQIYRVDRGTYIDSALREIYDVYMAAGSASSIREGGLADHVPKDTTITKRQLDFGARQMLEKVSLLSNGDYKQSTMLQLPWIALTAQLSQPPRPSQSVSDPRILKITKH